MSIPIYVTRSYQDGNRTQAGIVSLPATLVWFAAVLILFNIIGWGIFGAVELVGKVI
jgi:hypothetical protein